jgi:hypothetical protein
MRLLILQGAFLLRILREQEADDFMDLFLAAHLDLSSVKRRPVFGRKNRQAQYTPEPAASSNSFFSA